MAATTDRPSGTTANPTLVESTVSATTNALVEKVDVPAWCYSMPDSQYQACSPAHVAARTTTTPDGRHRTAGDRSLERLHLRGRQGTGTGQDDRRAKRLRPAYGARVGRRARRWLRVLYANTASTSNSRFNGIGQVIVIRLLTNTSYEATVRHADEFGYRPTVVRDATASLAPEETVASLDVNLPNDAAITTTSEIVDALTRVEAVT